MMLAGTPRPEEAPPHNIEAEQGLLGAILINNDAFSLTASIVSPEDFYEPLHGQIFETCGRLLAEGRRITPVALKDCFPDIDIAGLKAGPYIARLAAEATTVINAPDYAKLIRDLAMVRSMDWVVRELLVSNNRLQTPGEGLALAWDRLDMLRSGLSDQAGDRAEIAVLMRRTIEKIESIDRDDDSVVPTGLNDLDAAIGGGLRSKRLYVLAGRPGMGKTAWICSTARRMAQRAGVRGGQAIFTLEIDGAEIAARIISDLMARTDAPVAYRDIVAASNLEEWLRDRVFSSADALSNLHIHVDASSGLTISEIEARARMQRDRMARNGVRLSTIWIDYLGLIKSGDRYRGNRVAELGEIALGAKNMAKRLDVAVVLLSQLNRGVEHRDDKRPNLADLRESGNIEEHADFCGFLYRSAYYIERSSDFRAKDQEAVNRMFEVKHKLELIIGKNRLGPTVGVDLYCDVANSHIDNWAYRAGGNP